MKYSYQIIKSFITHPVEFVRVISMKNKLLNPGLRWHNTENLRSDWDERTEQIASLIPHSSKVLEFGAGRLVLKDLLCKTCEYRPSDIVDRGFNTIVCDLNISYPCFDCNYTHMVFSGVLEYISDIDQLLKNISNNTDYIITSYAPTDKLNDYITRRQHDWVNHYSNEEFINIFKNNGFANIKLVSWKEQNIYVFKKC